MYSEFLSKSTGVCEIEGGVLVLQMDLTRK